MKLTRSHWRVFIRQIIKERRGVASVELALVLPLLVVLYGATVEIGRFTMVRQRFETAVNSVARLTARYPEFEIRSRTYPIPIVAAIMPEGYTNLDISIDSLTKSNGAVTEVFDTYILFGSTPALRWETELRPDDYLDGEAIIFVSARYNYRPLFSFFGVSRTLTKTVALQPYFSRTLVWNPGQSANKYVIDAR